MPKTHVEHANFTTIEKSIESIIDGLPGAGSVFEKMPILYTRFGLRQSDIAHAKGDQSGKKPSRESLRLLESGTEPGENTRKKLEYAVKVALNHCKGATPEQAGRVAAWLARDEPPRKKRKAPAVSKKVTTEAVASQFSIPEANSPAACLISDHERECRSIREATEQARQAAAQAESHQQNTLEGLAVALWHSKRWQELAKDAARNATQQAERVAGIRADMEDLLRPDNLEERAFRLPSLRKELALEEALQALREDLQHARTQAAERWATVAEGTKRHL